MIEWTINLECGYANIDEQHKKLLEIMNNIAYILENKSYDFENLFQVVTELDTYVIEHFSYEEALMNKYTYPELEDHLFEHHYFRLKMKDLNIYDVKNKETFVYDILNFVSSWLLNHIVNTDRKLGTYIAQKLI